MMQEKYTHTRNYKCRLRRYIYNGVDMLSMENSKIKVVVALGKGADIVELVYKPLDVDFMWHSFNPIGGADHLPTVASSGGSFLDSYAGGWQDLFPTYGGRALYNGGEIGIHGEACIYPWNCEIVQDTPDCIEAKLSLRTMRSPFLVERYLKLTEGDTALDIREVITNEGAVEQKFMWGQHPAFGVPFLDDSVRIRLPGKPDVLVPAGTIAHHCPFDQETSGQWPLLPGKDGKMIDMSRAYAPDDKLYMEYCISNLEEGKYEVVNENMGLGLRMLWDKELCPNIWVWGLYCGIDVYPWYGRSYVLAVEPWSTYPSDYNAAEKNGGMPSLGAGEKMETSIRTEIFLEGKDA